MARNTKSGKHYTSSSQSPVALYPFSELTGSETGNARGKKTADRLCQCRLQCHHQSNTTLDSTHKTNYLFLNIIQISTDKNRLLVSVFSHAAFHVCVHNTIPLTTTTSLACNKTTTKAEKSHHQTISQELYLTMHTMGGT